MKWWQYVLRGIGWIVTMPIGIGWLLNRKGERIGTLVDMTTAKEAPVYEYKWWVNDRFSTAWFPGPLLSPRRAADLRRILDRDGVLTRNTLDGAHLLELVLHEDRHAWQQFVVCSIAWAATVATAVCLGSWWMLGTLPFVGLLRFLVVYGIPFLVSWPFLGWYDAYYALPLEKDARDYADRMMDRGGWVIRAG